jgi:hypothetical protein
MSAPHQTVSIPSLEKKNLSAEHLEVVVAQEHNVEYLARYPLIANKSTEELRKIEKGLLRKLDWIFLPVVCSLDKSGGQIVSDSLLIGHAHVVDGLPRSYQCW